MMMMMMMMTVMVVTKNCYKNRTVQYICNIALFATVFTDTNINTCSMTNLI